MNSLKNSFPGQHIDEPVFVFARPFSLLFIPIAFIFFLIIGFASLAQFTLASGLLVVFGIEPSVLILILGTLQLFFILVLMISIFDFYFDILIVTDRRMVDIAQEQLFFRQISELSLEDIEDVTSSVKGFLGTMFNYGKIEVQTAGQKNNFMYDNIRHPREIAAIVMDLSEQAKEGLEDNQRIPQTPVLGVINSNTINSTDELMRTGAITNKDILTRTKRDAP